MKKVIARMTMRGAIALITSCVCLIIAYASIPVPAQKPGIVRVHPAENLERFALRVNVPLDEIKRLNGLKPPFVIYINQPLITGSFPFKESTSVIKRSVATIASTDEVFSSSNTIVVPALSKKPKHLKIRRAPTLSRSSSHFIWPLEGKIISHFKEKHNGILLSAKGKTPVRAAENGIVEYVGENLKGLGCVILLKHAQGWRTVYGKIGEVSIKRGDIVNVGDIIGYLAEYKDSQLLFEVHRYAEPQDPLKNMLKSHRRV